MRWTRHCVQTAAELRRIGLQEAYRRMRVGFGREMLIEAVEKRFGAVEAVPAGHLLQFLSDNGGACIAHETRHITRSPGLTPVNTPVCSPQSDVSPI